MSKQDKGAQHAPTKQRLTEAVTHTPEADLSDTIAHNRGLPLLAVDSIPHPPQGYRVTDTDGRIRRFRRLAADLRSEAMDALREASGRDLQADLGRFAPTADRAKALVERLQQSGEMVARAEALVAYAREIDQIGLSDALIFLESEQKQYANAVEHDAALATHYRALVTLFAMRSGAIAEGIARSRSADAAASDPTEPSAAETAAK